MICIPRDDRIVLANFYNATPNKIANKSAEDLIHDVGFRVYTEWLRSPEERQDVQSSKYNGEGFLNWVAGETHYDLLRRGFTWDKDLKIFLDIPQKLTPRTYNEARQEVLHAVTLRAIDFFKNEKPSSTIAFDPRYPSIRTSLENYLKLIR